VDYELIYHEVVTISTREMIKHRRNALDVSRIEVRLELEYSCTYDIGIR
jgi:hypothetical protein